MNSNEQEVLLKGLGPTILPSIRAAFNLSASTKGHSEGDFSCCVHFKCFVDSEPRRPRWVRIVVVFPEKCALTSMRVRRAAI